MSAITVPIIGGGSHRVDPQTIECPFCHTRIIPEYYVYHDYVVLAKCPNTDCSKHFVLSEAPPNTFTTIQQNAAPANRHFSDIIRGISPAFESIYNQAYYAEQYELDQICGVGYRKSLEFLIKDYLISNTEDETEKESIKKKFLSNCIQDDVKDTNIKNVAKRAVWLGNDETHYVRIWQGKDVTNLKQLIDLTIRWIENEVETKRIIEEMS